MLRMAIPNKGALSDGAVALMTEAGYRCRRVGRELIVADQEHDVEFVFLRPRDIAVYVANGILDLGISGRDLVLDSRTEVAELMALNFGKSSFYYAVPAEGNLTPDDFSGLRIASSYPEIVREDLKKRRLQAKIICLDGAVEVSVKLGVADVIADVVESGNTLKEAGLKTVGDPILRSEAVMIGRRREVLAEPEVKVIVERITGILVARSYAMVEYDIPRASLDDGCRITPGIEAPTIAPLSNPDWAAVKSMVRRRDVNRIMDELHTVGAKGIIITDIKTCRL